MDRILVWNTRGLNRGNKQVEVRNFISKHQIALFGLLETKVKIPKLRNLYQTLCPGWCFASNNSIIDRGRIVIAWLPEAFMVSIELMTSQIVHLKVDLVGNVPWFYCTFVYGSNDSHEREDMWKSINQISTNDPWVILGDFNVVLNLDERIGSPVRLSEVKDFRECVEKCGLGDIKQAGRFYTWNNKQEGENRVFSKIDRVMANTTWLENFDNVVVTFLHEGEYDHCPGIVSVHQGCGGKKPFRFFNMWVQGDGFMEEVKRRWEGVVRGCKMFKVIQKLKRLKEALKLRNQHGFSDIQARAIQAYQRMITAQDKVHVHGRDANMITDEKQATEQYKQAQGRYLSFLKQKTKEMWIDKGDDNTKMFHQSIKARRSRNRVYAIQDKHGSWQNEEKGVKEAFVQYYQELLGESLDNRCAVKSRIIAEGPVLTPEQQRLLSCNFTRQDVKRVMHLFLMTNHLEWMGLIASFLNIAGT